MCYQLVQTTCVELYGIERPAVFGGRQPDTLLNPPVWSRNYVLSKGKNVHPLCSRTVVKSAVFWSMQICMSCYGTEKQCHSAVDHSYLFHHPNMSSPHGIKQDLSLLAILLQPQSVNWSLNEIYNRSYSFGQLALLVFMQCVIFVGMQITQSFIFSGFHQVVG